MSTHTFPWPTAVALMATAVAMGTFCAPTSAETQVKGPAKVAVSGRLAPKALPRKGKAPVSVTLEGRISGTRKGPLPQLRKIGFAINSYGHLDLAGLPVCRVGHIQLSSNTEAMEACGEALVGTGDFAANVKVTPQYDGIGTVDAFARIGGAGNPCLPPQIEVQAWNGGVKVEAPFFLVAYR